MTTTSSATIAPSFFRDLSTFQRDRFDLRDGLRGAAIFLLPVGIGLATGYASAGAVAGLGTLNLLLVVNPRASRTNVRTLAVACVLNALTFGVGVYLPTLPPFLEVPLLAIGVFVLLFATRASEWQSVGLIGSVLLVVGVGLAPTHVPFPGAGVLLIGLGGAWGILGILLTRPFVPKAVGAREARMPAVDQQAGSALPDALMHAAVVGVTVALGLAVGLALDLPRDFWIMLTILVALRADLASTTSYAGMRIVGTIAGAFLAFWVSVYVSSSLALFLILAFAAALTFATRSVNYAVFATWITLVVITLLDLVFAGGPELAVIRVLDTVIGGAMALSAAFLLSIAWHRKAVPGVPVAR
jgi:uncharacterized membrane protein YccC